MRLTAGDLLLVTGATGLVGSHVAEKASQQGWRVRALVRANANVGLLRALNLELVYGDLDQPACFGLANFDSGLGERWQKLARLRKNKSTS